MNRNRWIIAGVLVFSSVALILFGFAMYYATKPTTTAVKPPAVHKHAPAAKKAVVKPAVATPKTEAPSKQMTVAVDDFAPSPTSATTTTVAPQAPQTIINNYYSYSAPPTPSSAPSPASRTVNVLSGNSLSINILSGNGSDRWNSGVEERGSRDEIQAP